MVQPPLCPKFHKAIELVGGRWTGAVLQVLLGGRLRFGELRDAIPQISDRMLSERLHALEAEGIVVRTVVPESPVRVEYALSEKGRELQATLAAISRWASRWVSAEPAAASRPATPARISAAPSPLRRRAPRTGRASRPRVPVR